MKTTLFWAAFFGATGIALGALGAHALKPLLTTTQQATFETGVRYQMYHALFLLAVAALQKAGLIRLGKGITWLTALGVVLFSFSLYALALQWVLGANLRFLGPITPVGGVLLMLAWLLLAVDAMRRKA